MRPAVDLATLLDAVVFNGCVGNCAAHGKNFSLIYFETGARLAPLYDLLSTVVYPELSTNLAMKVGNTARFEKVGPLQWDRLAKDAELGAPQVRRRVRHVAQAIGSAASRVADRFAAAMPSPVLERIEAVIRKRTRAVLARLAT